MEPYLFRAGTSPLLVSMPHVGIHIPGTIAADMTDAALGVPDTDWNVHRLYDFLGEMGASLLQATHSRYVIDLNRSPSGEALYPGAHSLTLGPASEGGCEVRLRIPLDTADPASGPAPISIRRAS